MHRSRPIVLVILAAAAACSKRDSNEGTLDLSQDRTLVATLTNDRGARPQPLPSACGTVAVATPPAAASQTQAQELDRQADVAAISGNTQEARSLLLRAASLDETNKSVAYHLARADETLGDRGGAMKAYCRYLALSPTSAESAEARQRVTDLSRSATRLASESAHVATAAHSGTVAATRQPSRVASLRRAVASATSHRRGGMSSNVVAERAHDAEMQGEPASTPTEVARAPEASGGDVVVARTPIDEPVPAQRTERRGPSTAQSSILGAAAGAILGAATGRDVKSAVIGAAAGGVLGGVVGRATRPAGR